MKLVLLLIIIILLMINTRETFNNVNNIPTFIINLDDGRREDGKCKKPT